MIDVALKEWAVICELLVAGEQSILIRKGGIAEAGGPGRFQLEVPRFALFPAWLHQLPERVKPAWRDRVQAYDREPDKITINGLGVVEHIWRVPSRESLDSLDGLHVWEPEHLDMRWSYKPSQPLYLLAVRAYRLAQPRTIANNPRYAGCKSWVDLNPGDAIDDQGATPVLNDEAFGRIVDQIDAAVHSI
jgi:hypothetical protein